MTGSHVLDTNTVIALLAGEPAVLAKIVDAAADVNERPAAVA